VTTRKSDIAVTPLVPQTLPTIANPGRRSVRVALLFAFTVIIAVLALLYPAWTRAHDLLNATWQEPWMLTGLVIVPWLFWRGTLGQEGKVARLRLGSLAVFHSGPRGLRPYLRDIPGVMRAVGAALMVLSLARPVSSIVPTTSSDEGIDVVLVLDLSGSMSAVMANLPDDLKALVPQNNRAVRPTRLDAAKAVLRDFISRRKTDRLGVVVFGRAAYVLSPPTLDYQLLDHLVSGMELSLIDPSGTAIGDAVGVAVARLRRSTAKSKAIVLLTDGDNTAGSLAPEYAAHLASVVGAKVFTVQIGNGDSAEVLAGYDMFGQPVYQTQRYPVDPQLLKKMADQTGGQMYVASDAAVLRDSLHDVLNRLEKTKFEATTASFEDLYRYFLLPGVLLLALEAVLRALVLRRFP
jgi:Ca-activated chloride channel family protein